MEDFSEKTKVFKDLGDPKRAMIVAMISCGEICACEILEKLEISQSTLSHHMKLLRECGLVKARCDGKWTYYTLDEKTIEQTKQNLIEITTESDNCICRD